MNELLFYLVYIDEYCKKSVFIIYWLCKNDSFVILFKRILKYWGFFCWKVIVWML